MSTPQPSELQRITMRITARDKANAEDRKRQRELIREAVKTATWDEVQAEAKVSRPTIMRALRRPD